MTADAPARLQQRKPERQLSTHRARGGAMAMAHSLWYSPFEEEPELWLAEASETSDDGRVWTVDVRSGATWHDVNDLPLVERSEVLDEGTVRFTCREPCPTFDINPGAHLPILPKHIWEKVTDPATFGDLPIGSGPYRLVRHDPDQLYVSFTGHCNPGLDPILEKATTLDVEGAHGRGQRQRRLVTRRCRRSRRCGRSPGCRPFGKNQKQDRRGRLGGDPRTGG